MSCIVYAPQYQRASWLPPAKRNFITAEPVVCEDVWIKSATGFAVNSGNADLQSTYDTIRAAEIAPAHIAHGSRVT